jgi:predicted TIM-barrel fold metal-dependent hydrolase
MAAEESTDQEGFPSGIGVIDTMLGIPSTEGGTYDFLAPLLKDRESIEDLEHPAGYQFRNLPDVPALGSVEEMIDYTVEQMDAHGIDKALVSVDPDGNAGAAALDRYPERFFGEVRVDPNEGMGALRRLTRAVDELGAKAAFVMPAFVSPQVPINDKRMYPVYAKCCELDVPVICTTGVPGPRVPMAPQDVALIDEVCYFFPELTFVMRHGAEPWTALAAKLMLKWPNLYYSTSGFAPKHYPADIVEFANTRGGDKVLYAGYFPSGLSLERIFAELPSVPFRTEVWPKFLRENSIRVFKLDEADA